MKRCNRCNEELPVGHFKRGQARCRPCLAIIERERWFAKRYPKGLQLSLSLDWTEHQRRRSIERAAAWNRANPEVRREAVRRRRARLAVPKGSGLTGVTRRQIADRWAYFGGCCWMCGDAATQTDHVKPLARGGLNVPANLRPICGPCNRAKSDAWPLNTELCAVVSIDAARAALAAVVPGQPFNEHRFRVALRRAA